jgi:exonuclease SbcD
MKILAAADIHLGRRSSKLPEAIAREHSPVRMWQKMIDFAIEERVAALLIAGDIVDQDRGFYEALNAIESGIERLDRAGIRCIAVAGNHDVEVLKRLQRTLETGNFHLLGQGGRWERVQLADPDGLQHVDIWGWSFPQAQVTTNPMPKLTTDMLEPGKPAIGMLHCDRDGSSDGVYCSVPGGDFARSGIGTWVLGHVHKPDRIDSVRSEPRHFYTGSPQPLDPGESGPHGPWMIEIGRDGTTTVIHIPLATVRYETVTVAVDTEDGELTTKDDLHAAVVHAVRAAARGIVADQPGLQHLCCRMRIVGKTVLDEEQLRDEWRRVFANDADAESFAVDKVTAHIEPSAAFDIRPHLDVEALANHSTPLGEAARLYLQLTGAREMSEEAEAHVEMIQQTVVCDVYSRVRSWLYEDAMFDREQARQLAAEQTRRLVEMLHVQGPGERNG